MQNNFIISVEIKVILKKMSMLILRFALRCIDIITQMIRSHNQSKFVVFLGILKEMDFHAVHVYSCSGLL